MSAVSWLARILSRGDRDAGAAPRGDPERVHAVLAVLERLTPLLAADGGDVRLVAVEEDDVLLEWRGACRACSARPLTLSAALEPALRAELGWLRHVRAVESG